MAHDPESTRQGSRGRPVLYVLIGALVLGVIYIIVALTVGSGDAEQNAVEQNIVEEGPGESPTPNLAPAEPSPSNDLPADSATTTPALPGAEPGAAITPPATDSGLPAAAGTPATP